MGKLDDVAKKIGSEIKRVRDDLESKIQVSEKQLEGLDSQIKSTQEKANGLYHLIDDVDLLSSKSNANKDQISELQLEVDRIDSVLNEATILLDQTQEIQALIDLKPAIQELINLKPEIQALLDLKPAIDELLNS